MDLTTQQDASDDPAAPARPPAAPRDVIRRRLTAAISDHLLPSGMKLPEEKLARYFNTSRPRIREVLSLLERDQLVEVQPNRGAFVARPTIQQTREICEARVIIESAMARLAAERVTSADAQMLREIVETERACWDKDDYTGAIRASREFHTKIAALAGNTVLSDTLTNILTRSALSEGYYASRGRSGCLCDDHFGLLSALTERDADQAESLMAAHIRHIQGRMNLTEPEDSVDIEEALNNVR